MKNTKKYAIISGFVIFAALFAVGAFAMPGIFGHQNMPSGPSNASIAINSAISGGDFSAFQVAVLSRACDLASPHGLALAFALLASVLDASL